MPFFSLKRAFTPPKGRTPGESFLRFVLLIAIFVGAGWLYSIHFNRTLDFIEARSAVFDQTKSLTPDQKQAFRDFSKVLKSEFGLELKLVFATKRPPWPTLDNKTVYFGLDTVGHTVDIAIPPLVERALGPGYVDMLKTEHFPPFFEQGAWARGTAEALADIWKRLLEVEKPTAPPQAPPKTSPDALSVTPNGAMNGEGTAGNAVSGRVEPPSETHPQTEPDNQ